MNQPSLNIGILTIRDDEFRAVLHTFARDHGIYKGRYREYTLSTADAGQGGRYRLAIFRQIEQGNARPKRPRGTIVAAQRKRWAKIRKTT